MVKLIDFSRQLIYKPVIAEIVVELIFSDVHKASANYYLMKIFPLK